MPATKPLPDHGTYARYIGRPSATPKIPGCRCTPCTNEGRTYNSRRYVLNATGRALTVTPDRAATHVRRLLDNGASWNTLRAAGCDNATTSALLNGTNPRIHRRTEQRILAIRLHDVIAPLHPMPALGTVRRLRALVAAGHQVQHLAELVGADRSTIREVLNGHTPTVTAQFAKKAAAVYELRAMTPGTCDRARSRGRREGWAPPLAWDDIDNPEAAPVIAPNLDEPVIDDVAVLRLIRGDRTVRLRPAEKPLAARELAAQGLTNWAIADALHVNTRSVREWLGELQPAAA